MKIVEIYSIFLETRILSASKYWRKFQSSRKSFIEAFCKILRWYWQRRLENLEHSWSVLYQMINTWILKTVLILYLSFSIIYNNYESGRATVGCSDGARNDRISKNSCCWSWTKEVLKGDLKKVLKKIWLNHGDLEILWYFHIRKGRDQCWWRLSWLVVKSLSRT